MSLLSGASLLVWFVTLDFLWFLWFWDLTPAPLWGASQGSEYLFTRAHARTRARAHAWGRQFLWFVWFWDLSPSSPAWVGLAWASPAWLGPCPPPGVYQKCLVFLVFLVFFISLAIWKKTKKPKRPKIFGIEFKSKKPKKTKIFAIFRCTRT